MRRLGMTPSPSTPNNRNKYNEWVQCLKTNDKDDTKCYLPRFNMRELCPVEWVRTYIDSLLLGLQTDRHNIHINVHTYTYMNNNRRRSGMLTGTRISLQAFKPRNKRRGIQSVVCVRSVCSCWGRKIEIQDEGAKEVALVFHLFGVKTKNYTYHGQWLSR